MNRTILSLLAILFIGTDNINAQESAKNSLFVISPGYAIFNNGEATGMSFSNEYIRIINSHFTYGARYMVAYAEGNVQKTDYQYDIHVSSSAFDFNGFFNPFKGHNHLLLIGLGISLDYTKTSYLSKTDSISIDNKIYSTADTYSTISLLEPIFSLHYYYNFNKNLYLGCNLNARDLSLYQYVLGISGAIKF